ncbi:MAG: hypothetical protein LQ350_001303 [Teloschistes chrysophthalmus]|nr:MAG: hypothetical protein LQ350_001303 [Niorma chrysophthalma]
MGIAFDYAPARPQNIDDILNGLDRYNPETTTVFESYVTQQCEDRTYDCYANLALLKLYQFNPHLLRDETTTNILTKSLTVFPSPDFSLCLHLLPSYILSPPSSSSSSTTTTTTPHHHSASNPTPGDAPLSEAVQKLTTLNNLLESAKYREFWQTLDKDDLYADLIADVGGFEELMRVRIAVTVGQSCREVERGVLEGWLALAGGGFEHFVREVCGWGVDETRGGKGGMVVIPVNKENEAKGTVVKEEVKFDQFARVIRRAYEQPA